MENRLVVQDVLSRIRELTGDLKKIQEEISQEVFRPGPASGRNIFLEVKDSTQVINQFRGAIDDLRHVVWLYIETVPNREISNPEAQRKLLARATEILCALSLNPPLPQPEIDPMDRSFVERLLQFMETWIDPRMREQMDHHEESHRAASA